MSASPRWAVSSPPPSPVAPRCAAAGTGALLSGRAFLKAEADKFNLTLPRARLFIRGAFGPQAAQPDLQERLTGLDLCENLLQTLELRMDNIIYRMGLAPSRNAARQLVRHNHFTVNGKKVNIPSYILSKGDEIAPNQKKIEKFPIKTALENMKNKSQPHWLAFDVEAKKGVVQDLPTREDITIPIQEQLIVELYSR